MYPTTYNLQGEYMKAIEIYLKNDEIVALYETLVKVEKALTFSNNRTWQDENALDAIKHLSHQLAMARDWMGNPRQAKEAGFRKMIAG